MFRYLKKIFNFSIWGLVAWYTEAIPFLHWAELSYGHQIPITQAKVQYQGRPCWLSERTSGTGTGSYLSTISPSYSTLTCHRELVPMLQYQGTQSPSISAYKLS